jgi:hypothetical protein
MYFLVFVDDLIIVGPTNTVNDFSARLEYRFKAVGPPPTDWFQYLGMIVTQIQVIHVGHPLMIADALTKALSGSAVSKFRADIGLSAN